MRVSKLKTQLMDFAFEQNEYGNRKPMKIIGEELERVAQMPRDEYRRGMLHGNGDHSANGTRMEKLEEKQGSIVRRRMPTKPIRPAMIYGAETLATTKR